MCVIWVVILNYINLNADFVGYFKLYLITSNLYKKVWSYFVLSFITVKMDLDVNRDSFKLSFIMTLVDKYRELFYIFS